MNKALRHIIYLIICAIVYPLYLQSSQFMLFAMVRILRGVRHLSAIRCVVNY